MALTHDNVFDQAYRCLCLSDPALKVQQTQQLSEHRLTDNEIAETDGEIVRIAVPGRPDKPRLVKPSEVPKRSFESIAGRLKLVHAIAHIEFNAINLALDAVYRFRDMPLQYYSDWLKVAAEEAFHFTLLHEYLASHHVKYGDYDAHNGLWEMAVMTDHDVMVRMALVPRVLEARGLDVTPGMIRKLERIGDQRLVKILQQIYRDEIGHVQIGSYWFNELCTQRSLHPDKTFSYLLDEYMQDACFGPFDNEVRLQAGFSQRELNNLIQRNRKPLQQPNKS